MKARIKWLIVLMTIGLVLAMGRIDAAGKAKGFPEGMVAGPGQLIIAGLKPMVIKTVFDRADMMFKGSSREKFVIVAGGLVSARRGIVSITRVVEPTGLPKGSLSANLDRNDFSGPVTKIILTGAIELPLTTTAGVYSDGLIEITVTSQL